MLRIINTERLNQILVYLHTKFIAPFAARDDEGNEIKTSYLKAGGKAVNAFHSDNADMASNAAHSATADVAKIAQKVEWGDVNGKPATFTAGGGRASTADRITSVGQSADDVSTPVWFSKNKDRNLPVTTEGFTYNPKQNALTVARVIGKADTAGTADTAKNVPWGNVSGKPATYPATAHNHNSEYPSTKGDRATGKWGINISGKADTAGTADTAKAVPWGNITGKPGSFTASAHTHDDRYRLKTDMAFSATTTHNKGIICKTIDSSMWGSWNQCIRFDNGSHAAIYNAAGGSFIGIHNNKNIYFGSHVDKKYYAEIHPDGYYGTFRGNVAGSSGSFSGNVSAPQFYTPNWFRAQGNGGIYWEKWGGGWFMQDATWIRSYNNKNVYINKVLKVDGGIQGNVDHFGGYDINGLKRLLQGRNRPSLTGILKRVYNNSNGATASHPTNATSKVSYWAMGGGGCIELTQSYRNFDRVVFFFSNSGDWCEMSVWDSWALELALSESWRLNINTGSHGGGAFWIHGSKRTEGNLKPTATLLRIQDIGTHLNNVWGVNY